MPSARDGRNAQRRPWSPGAMIMVATLVACAGGERKAAAGDTAGATAGAAAAPAAAPGSVAAAPAGGAAGGEQIYQRCATCHQANGQGLAGTFPPLAGSEYATAANVAVPIRIVLHGLQGPVTVKGTSYNSLMPPYGTSVEMSNEEVAAVLTYVRHAWGNGASAVTPEQVATERAAKRTVSGAATAEELKTLM